MKHCTYASYYYYKYLIYMDINFILKLISQGFADYLAFVITQVNQFLLLTNKVSGRKAKSEGKIDHTMVECFNFSEKKIESMNFVKTEIG